MPKPIPKEISKIGLVISAGFFNNSLPLIKWVEYAQFFMRHYKAKITIIAGPAEISDAKILSQIIKNSNVVLGGQNVDEFLKLIRDLDLLIATDSGLSYQAFLEFQFYLYLEQALINDINLLGHLIESFA